MPLSALPYITLLGFLFGSTLIASRFSVGQFHPSTYIGLRLVLASLGHLGIFIMLRRWPRDARLWRHAVVLGVIGLVIPMNAIVNALQFLSSGLTAIFLAVVPAGVVVLAHFFLPAERLSARKGFGVALALSGAVLLVVRGESGLPAVSTADPRGALLMVLALVSGSSSVVYARRFLSEYDPLDVAAIRMLTGAVIVMPLSLLLIGFDLTQVDARGFGALGYAALVGTFSAMLLQFYIVKRFGATAAAMTTYFIPMFAAFGGALILGETVTPGMAYGMLVIVVGITIVNRRKRRSDVLKPLPEPPVDTI